MLFSRKQRRSGGFSIIEIMIVVVIIGLLASMAIIGFSYNRTRVQASTLGLDMRQFRDALEQCILDTGDLALGAPAGQVSSVFDPYVRKAYFEKQSPVGGQWIVESKVDGFELILGVVDFTSSMEAIELADRLYDDGNVASGRMRLFGANKYSYIVVE